MNNVKAITNIPGWSSLFKSNELNNAAKAYVYVPLIYRALRLRCDALASVPVTINGRGENEQEWPFPNRLSTLIWYTEAALLLKGVAFWEKVGNPVGKVTDVKWRNPFSMKLEYKDNILTLEQENVTNARWKNDLAKGIYEMVYFHEFHPMDDVTAGVGAVDSALTDAQLIRYLTRFASIFFEQGAQPLTLLGFENTPTPEEKTRTEAFFKKAAQGIRNAWRVFAFRGKVDVHTITPPLKEMVIPELHTQAQENIAQSFGIPQTMLADAANYATSKEHRLSYWQDTVRPRSLIYEDVINTQLLSKLGLEFAFNFDQMDIFQEDEASRAQSLKDLVEAGASLEFAMEILGYDLTEEQIAKYFSDMEPEDKMDNIGESSDSKVKSEPEIFGYHIDSGVVEKNEVRERLGLPPIDDPEAKERSQLLEKLTVMQAAVNARIDPVSAGQMVGIEVNNPQPQIDNQSLDDDLKKWKAKAITRMKEGKPDKMDFVSRTLPPALSGAISGALEEVKTVDDINAVFDNIWLGYP